MSDISKVKRRAWLVYLLVGYALLAVWEFVPGARIGLLFNAIALSSPVAIVVAVHMWKPRQRAPWYLFAVGQALLVGGDVTADTYAYSHERLWHGPLPYPSIGEVLYVYTFLVLGVLLLVRRGGHGRDREGLIESLIVAIGIGTVWWVYVMGPIALDSQSSTIDRLVGMADPFVDLILLTVIVRLVIGWSGRTGSLRLLASGALTLVVTNFAYGLISVGGAVHDEVGYLGAGWATFHLLWGAAALHGSMRRLSDGVPHHEVGLTRSRLVLLAVASLTAQVMWILQLMRGQRSDLWVIMLATVAIFVLVVLRMSGLVHKLELSFHRERTLRAAGASLVTATNRAGIHAAAMQAVKTLVPDGSASLLALTETDAGRVLSVVATTESDASLDSVIRPNELPPISSSRLQRHQVLPVPGDDSRIPARWGLAVDSTSVLIWRLLQRGELNSLLAVGVTRPLSRSTCNSIDALSSQVALALESAALTEDLLRGESEARFRSLVQNSSDVVMVVDEDSTIRYISPSVKGILGHEGKDLEDVTLTSLIDADDRARLLRFLAQGGRDTDRPAVGEFRLLHHEGYWVDVEVLRTDLLGNDHVRGIVLNTRDISERKAFEEQLRHEAFHDSVTSLANGALFRDRVQHALERQQREGRPISVLFMDLDDFKTVNDSLGHAAGDELLRGVGTRLCGSLRSADTAARLGGDEFGILLGDGADSVEAADVATRVLRSFELPFHVEDHDVFVRASIGIATARGDGPEAGAKTEALLRNADVAMYMAKESGKGRYRVFEPEMHHAALRRLEMKADLQRAIEKGEFVLHYQPVVDLRTGRISGVEALVRWNQPRQGIVAPLDFIPLAEETGLIVAIGRWVLETACADAVRLQRRHELQPPLHMAVNLSARQLQRREIAKEVAGVLRASGLDPRYLILEITESVMMADVQLSLQRLTELKELDVKLALDDFGTGYSSLNYIQQFPVDILKIDRSFIDAFTTDDRKSVLTATIIKLAEQLDLRPVAEGIERVDQLEKLLELDCDLGQGYYFARPLPIEEIDELLSARLVPADRYAGLSS